MSAAMHRLRLFLSLVWRRNNYWCHWQRWSVSSAWFAAGVIAETCRAIREGR